MAVLSESGPEAADRAIGCEKCHGPGGNHLLAVNAPDAKDDPSIFLRDMAIARPSTTYGEPIVKLCGQCHDPRKVGFEVTPSLETAEPVPGDHALLEPLLHREPKEPRLRHLPQPAPRRRDEPPRTTKRNAWNATPAARVATQAASSLLHPQAAAYTAVAPLPRATEVRLHRLPHAKDQTPIPHSRFTDHHIRVHPELEGGEKPVAGH